MRVVTYEKGKIVKDVGTAETPKEKEPPVNVATISEADFRKKILKALGIPCI